MTKQKSNCSYRGEILYKQKAEGAKLKANDQK
jgi:hypothetical protein